MLMLNILAIDMLAISARPAAFIVGALILIPVALIAFFVLFIFGKFRK
jgi:hypothetical protein